MAKNLSAGLLMYRRTADNGVEVFLVHPGGPFYAHKDEGSWTVPKGGVEEGEDVLAAAAREFEEETGIAPDLSKTLALDSVKQRSGKTVTAWAFENDWRGDFKSNTFEMEFPPKSGQMQSFPEADRGQFFTIEEARRKILPPQAEFLDRLLALVQ